MRVSLSQIRRLHCHPTSPRRRLIDLGSSVREFVTLGRARPAVRPSAITVSSLHRHYGTTSRRRFVLRWYHDPRKVTAATAITLSATVMAACTYCYDREIVPCTYRSHLVVYSHQEERDLADAAFAEHKAELVEKNMIVDPRDPRSIRVRLIAERIVHAAHRGLGIYDTNDAPMLRVTQNRQRWGKAQPRTSHLHGINWEVTLVRDLNPNIGITPSGQIMVTTGFFDWHKTDGEIAAALGHELGHVIARHCGEISNSHWLLENIFSRRKEIEADYIGILLLGAAGFHPQWALVVLENGANFERFSISHPNPKKRLQLLSEARTTMQEALELYREATALEKVTDRYFW